MTIGTISLLGELKAPETSDCTRVCSGVGFLIIPLVLVTPPHNSSHKSLQVFLSELLEEERILPPVHVLTDLVTLTGRVLVRRTYLGYFLT